MTCKEHLQAKFEQERDKLARKFQKYRHKLSLKPRKTDFVYAPVDSNYTLVCYLGLSQGGIIILKAKPAAIWQQGSRFALLILPYFSLSSAFSTVFRK